MGVSLTVAPFSGLFVLVVVVASVLKIHEIRQKQKKRKKKKVKSENMQYSITSHETFSQYHTPQVISYYNRMSWEIKKNQSPKKMMKKKKKRSRFIQLVGQFNCTKCLISILKALPLK